MNSTKPSENGCVLRTLMNIIKEKARREGGICNSRVIVALPNNVQYFPVFFIIIERVRDGGICNSRVIMVLPTPLASSTTGVARALLLFSEEI